MSMKPSITRAAEATALWFRRPSKVSRYNQFTANYLTADGMSELRVRVADYADLDRWPDGRMLVIQQVDASIPGHFGFTMYLRDLENLLVGEKIMVQSICNDRLDGFLARQGYRIYYGQNSRIKLVKAELEV